MNKKKEFSSDASKQSSESSYNFKTEYSLREISNLSEENLVGKIFTFQKNLIQSDKTKIQTD